MSGPTRAGTVAIVGRPNVGKSSLLNRFLGQKISIVTPRAQTTRERILGIDTRQGAQIVFLDTPGLLDPSYLLHASMRHVAFATLSDADVTLLVLDATEGIPAQLGMGREVRSASRELVGALNKADLVAPGAARGLTDRAEAALGAPVAAVSAITGEGVDELRDRLARRLPESPYLYPEDEIAAQPVRFFAAELVREAVFELYVQEISYGVVVKVEEFREDRAPIYIRATIFVERASQRGIVIGEGGRAIRRLGVRAREKIEAFLDQEVYLDLWVKVLPNWKRDRTALRRLGFSLPETTA